MRGWIKRLERESREDLGSFELLDGSRFYFDPSEVFKAIFLHWSECIGTSAHNWPEPPEVVHMLIEAKDIERAVEKVRGEGWSFLVYDEDILINERRLEPRGLVTSRDPDTGEWHVRDPYEDLCPRDLSEP